MSERGQFRGGRGGGRGGRGGNNERGGRGGGGAGAGQATERPKRENILDLSKYQDKEVMVKFSGGREGVSISLRAHLSFVAMRAVNVLDSFY